MTKSTSTKDSIILRITRFHKNWGIWRETKLDHADTD